MCLLARLSLFPSHCALTGKVHPEAASLGGLLAVWAAGAVGFPCVSSPAFVPGGVHVSAFVWRSESNAECLSFRKQLPFSFETGSHVCLVHRVGSADWLASFYQSLPPALACHDEIPSTCYHVQIFMSSREPRLKSSHLPGQPLFSSFLNSINWPVLTEFSYRQGSYQTAHLYISKARPF